ncbi:MAG: MarR family transcriptional regulator [Peptoniphilaceae bacterium]
MLEEQFKEVYDKFKLNFYRNIFGGFEDREATLTSTETFCVEVIHSLSNPTINQLADFLKISQPNMTYKINNLVKKGYVVKEHSNEDKREFYLKVTDKFFNYYEIKNEYMNIVLKRAKNRFNEEELKSFEHILNVISKELMHEITDDIAKSKNY